MHSNTTQPWTTKFNITKNNNSLLQNKHIDYMKKFIIIIEIRRTKMNSTSAQSNGARTILILADFVN